MFGAMLRDEKIIITGAAGGLGQAIAKHALEAGAVVALFEKTEALAAAARDNLAAYDHVSTYAADLTNAAGLEAAVQQASAQMRGITGLVNNAAILCQDDSDPVTTSQESWNSTLQVNVTGAFLMCKFCLPHLQANGGSIVTMSSVVAHAASAIPQIAYTASKGALEAMTREIAIRYARNNIRANCVAPGPVRTARTEHYFSSEENWAKRQRYIPMGRLGQADEIAALVTFLLSPQAGYVTGATYRADGGISAAYIAADEKPS
jgi:NAD(P)-dependent dehydrogenase (short-subunit alcohol dehydrogenase family)